MNCEKVWPAIWSFTAATVILLPHKNENSISGKVEFYQSNLSNSPLLVKGSLNNLPEGKHGFHVHELKILGNDCTSAGGHFNPENVRHFPNLINLKSKKHLILRN